MKVYIIEQRDGFGRHCIAAVCATRQAAQKLVDAWTAQSTGPAPFWGIEEHDVREEWRIE